MANSIFSKKSFNHAQGQLDMLAQDGLQADSRDLLQNDETVKDSIMADREKAREKADREVQKLQNSENVKAGENMNVKNEEKAVGERYSGAVVILNGKQLLRMKNWAQRVGLTESDVAKLQEKYGVNSYNMMLRALMEPAQLTKDIGIRFMSSKKVIQYLLNNDLTAEQKAACLRGKYGTYKEQSNVAPAGPEEPKRQDSNSVTIREKQEKSAQEVSATSAPATDKKTAEIQSEAGSERGMPTEEKNIAEAKNKHKSEDDNAASPLSADVVKTPANLSPAQKQRIYNHVLQVRSAAYKKIKQRMPDDTKQIVDTIIYTAQRKGIDPCLALAVAEKESEFVTTAGSKAGAVGLFQIMPANISGFKGNRLNPMENIEGGINMLKANLIMYDGDLLKGLKAYNWGCGHLNNALKRGVSPQAAGPLETRQYAPKILKQTDVYRQLLGLAEYAYNQYYGTGTSENMIASAKGRNTGRNA